MNRLTTMWSPSIVLYDNFFDNRPKCPSYEGEDLVSLLTTFDPPRCDVATCEGRQKCGAKKTTKCWSPVAYAPDTTRLNDNVIAIHYAVYDLDHLKAGELDRILADSAEYEYVVHSTHSHSLDDQSYRLVFPLSRPVEPSEWEAVHDSVIAALGLPADPCGDLSRIYACPTARGGVEPVALHRRGKPIDVEDALQVAKELGLIEAKPASVPQPAPLPPQETYSLDQLRDLLSSARRSKANSNERHKEQAKVLGKILDGEAIAETGARDNKLLAACGLLAFWLPANIPWEVVVELIRPSLNQMDCEPEGLPYWIDRAKDMYLRAAIAREKADKKRAEEDAFIGALKKSVANKSLKNAAADMLEGWETLLISTKSGPKICEHNVDVILTCAPEMRDMLVWNEFTKEIEVRGGPLVGAPSGSLDGKAAGWIQYQYQCMAGEHMVGKALLRVARDNPYDPIAEYLSEIAWDGEARIDTFLEKYLGADVSTPERARYVRIVSRRWLISLVARALRPGCKVDTVLILEGAQGTRKSSALKALVGPQYFLDTAITLGDKDSMQAIAGAWLVELGELASFRKAETGKIKQFITSQIDKFRPPFGRVVESFARRCVLVGSTNDKEYLQDPTGNRRYWPVSIVGDIAVDDVERDRDLILAETVAAFQAGECWWFKPDETHLAAAETDDRMGVSTAEEAIERWWYGLTPAKRPNEIGILDVSDMALKMAIDRVDHRVRCEIGYALRRLGFVRKGRGRAYTPTEILLTSPMKISASRAALSLVPAAPTKATS